MSKALKGLAIAAACLTLIAAAESPSIHLETKIKEIVQFINSSEDESALDAGLESRLRPLFDIEEMTKRSMGSHWRKASTSQQQEIVDLFGRLLLKTYAGRLKSASEYEIKFLRERVSGNKAIVSSSVEKGDEEYSFVYKLHTKSPPTWLIYDVVVENVGIASNYRNQFSHIIRKKGIKGLISKLRAKVN